MKRLYMAKLKAWKSKSKRKPLLLKGVRQVGKTYLLKKFGKECFPKFHYLNFEKMPNLKEIFEKDLDPKRIIDELSFFLNESINIQKDFVIFDEIQECPKALTSLKYFNEDLPELCLCGAGSLLGIHLSPLSFPVGKVDFLTLRPMNFEEFLIACEDYKAIEFINDFKEKKEIPSIVHKHLWKMLKYYFVVGGLPEAVETFCKYKDDLYLAFNRVREKQDALVIAYFADIAKHSGKVNAMHIERIFNSVPMQLEKSHEKSSSRFRFKGVVPGISHYQRLADAIDWLEAAGLVLKISIVNQATLPLKAYGKDSLFKLFLFDIGILGALVGLSPSVILDYDYGSYKGYFAENFVAQELLSSGLNDLYCWSEKQSQIEFIQDIKGHAIPIEVKSGAITRAKSLDVFTKKYHPSYQIILSAKPYRYFDKKNIYQYPLFLAGKITDLH